MSQSLEEFYSDQTSPDLTYSSPFINHHIVYGRKVTQYRAGDKIEKNEMGWACGAYG